MPVNKRVLGRRIVINLNAKKGYNVSPGEGNIRKKAVQRCAMERKKDERNINLGQMDAATCEALNGTQNENRQCMVKSDENPDDSDVLIIRKMRYMKPGDGFDFNEHETVKSAIQQIKEFEKKKNLSMLDRKGLAKASAILKKYEQQNKLQEFVEKKISEHVPSLDKRINEIIEAGEVLPVFKPKEELTVKEVKEYKPYSVDWAVRQIEICISKGYEEDLCVGAVLGEVRKKGKYEELDSLFDESIPNNFDDRLIVLIERGKNRYDTRYAEKIKFLTETYPIVHGLPCRVETQRIRDRAINAVYPSFDEIMRRPLTPKDELIDKARPGGDIPEWLYEERDKSGFIYKGAGGRPRLAGSMPLSTKEQQEEIEKRFKEMTRAQQKESRRKIFLDKEQLKHMDSEQKRKHWNEVNRNYYYLNRYGMTEEEYKKRKRTS